MQKYKKESIYIIFSPIFFGLYIIFGGGILKLLPFQGARRADMNTQGGALGSELLPLQGVRGMALFAYIFQI